MSDPTGVVFPEVDGRRSTGATGRAVVADALRPVDPVGAAAAARETNWRSGYLTHFRRLVEAGLARPEDAVAIADAGLASLYDRMLLARPRRTPGPPRGRARRGRRQPRRPAGHRGAPRWWRGRAHPHGALPRPPPRGRRPAPPARHLGRRRRRRAQPARGGRARSSTTPSGCASRGASWSCSARRPRWARCARCCGGAARSRPSTCPGPTCGPGCSATPAVSPAGCSSRPPLARPTSPSERGSTSSTTCRRPPAGSAACRGRSSSATTSTPTAPPTCGSAPPSTPSPRRCARPAPTPRCRSSPPPPTCSPCPVRPSPRRCRPTPTAARPRCCAARCAPSRAAACCGATTSPARTPASTTPSCSSRAPTTSWPSGSSAGGPPTARAQGATVSFKIAPPTRTRSVVKNRGLAAAYAGAHRFGVEVFDPGTANTLMAALLVHDLSAGSPRQEHPWQDEAYAAAHGGLWRAAYDPRSALGLAALLGAASARP